MAVKTFTTGEVLTAADTNTYLANAGLVYVTSTTVGTAVASVTISNCFSSTYDHYRVVIAGIVNSTAANLTGQLSGITGSTYSTGGTFFTYGSATVSGFGPAATTSWVIGVAGATNSHAVIDILSPNTATTKGMFTQGTSTVAYYSFGGTCTSTSTATGLVVAPNAGTMTGGTITVYGYRNG